MLSKVSAIVFAAAGISGVAAHGGVLSYGNAGNWYFGWQPYNSPTGQTTVQRPWSSYNPIQDATVTTLACNDDGTSPATGQLTMTIAAGSSVTAYWNQIWPHNTGPVLTYLASCGSGSCTGVNANTLKWFKIQQAGLLGGTVYNGSWAAGQMINQNSSWTTVIPATVPSGNYLLRFETIALHSMPAQFYPECAQVQITGGGSLQPTAAQLVSFPGAYSNSDPGVNIDIYGQAAQTQTTYVIPGPPLYGSAATGGSPPASSSVPIVSSTAPPASSTLPPVTSSKPPASTTAAPQATATHYGQCGGQGWTGATACASPYKCTVSSQYYSQCL